jgi:hypothetical protein
MKQVSLIVAILGLAGMADAATRREVFSNSAVHLSFACGSLSSSGSGFIFFRPADITKANEPNVKGQIFLVTNKHVLPPEGPKVAGCKLAVRISTTSGGTITTQTIDIPIVGADEKYVDNVSIG